MSRYFSIGTLAIILLFFLHATSFGMEGVTNTAQKGCENASLCDEDSCMSSNNKVSYSQYPLEIFTNIYGAISRVDGNRCPMYPTCSHYSLEAIGKHGLLIGIVMTFDRLIHESNEMDYAPLVEVGDAVRYADPVENNDFWWSD